MSVPAVTMPATLPAALPAAVLVAMPSDINERLMNRLVKFEAAFEARLRAVSEAEARAQAESEKIVFQATQLHQAEVAKLNAKIAELASAKSQEQQSRSESSNGKFSMRVCHFLLNRAHFHWFNRFDYLRLILCVFPGL